MPATITRAAAMVDNQAISEEEDFKGQFDKIHHQHSEENGEDDNNIFAGNEDDEDSSTPTQERPSHDDTCYDESGSYEDHPQSLGDNNLVSQPDDNQNDDHVNADVDDDDDVPMKSEDNDRDVDGHAASENVKLEPGVDQQNAVWKLPAERNDCTLEEIRRGQVINKVAPNECPVLGCGKKINEMRAEPSPGTIASGLRTHVLFVHYANRKVSKKRKLGWTTKRRSQQSPRKQIGQISTHSSPSASEQDFDSESQNNNNLANCLNLTQKSNPAGQSIIANNTANNASLNTCGLTLHKKIKQLAAKSQALQQHSSLQSLMQATGGSDITNRLSPQPNKQKSQSSLAQNKFNTNVNTNANINPNSNPNNFNQTTSSLFSILAGLTQQQPQTSSSRNVKTAHGTNTINISQCSRNSIPSNSNNNRPVNSSLLSLLNEKISGNVATSLQTQLKKSLGADSRTKKVPNSTPRPNISSPANSSYYQANNNDSSFNSNQATASLLNSLYSANGSDNRLSYDNSMPLNSFIESIATRTGSNIGPTGVAEAKKIIEKFTTSLICSSQTIADHYIAPFAGEVPQQKPEISPSDVLLAYKMMHKSHGQP